MSGEAGAGAPAFTVRRATIADAPELARLFTQLGHPTDAARIEAYWARFEGAGDMALVADDGDGVLFGVATLHHMVVLHRPYPVGRITSLIVEEQLRGQGIGRVLVEAAEAELRAVGCRLLEITSNVRRIEAHAFYEGLGYEKTSVRLAKQL